MADPCEGCGEPSICVMRRKPLCIACVVQRAERAIRGGMSFRNVAVKDKVVIACSGDTNSRVLVHYAHTFVDQSPRGNPRLKGVQILHIDERPLHKQQQSSTTPEAEAEAGAGAALVPSGSSSFLGLFSDAERATFPRQHVVPLARLYELQTSDRLAAAGEDDNGNGDSGSLSEEWDKLRALFSTLTTIGAREALLAVLRLRLIAAWCKGNDVNCVLLGSSADTVSTDALVNVCHGAGFAVPQLGAPQFHVDGVKFVYAQRELLSKELSLYVRHKGLSVQPHVTFSTGQPIKSSLQKVTENFVQMLQGVTPMSSHSLLRTVDKLTTRTEDTDGACALCCRNMSHDERVKAEAQTTAEGEEHDGGAGSSDRVDVLCRGCTMLVRESTSHIDVGRYMPLPDAQSAIRHLRQPPASSSSISTKTTAS